MNSFTSFYVCRFSYIFVPIFPVTVNPLWRYFINRLGVLGWPALITISCWFRIAVSVEDDNTNCRMVSFSRLFKIKPTWHALISNHFNTCRNRDPGEPPVRAQPGGHLVQQFRYLFNTGLAIKERHVIPKLVKTGGRQISTTKKVCLVGGLPLNVTSVVDM